MAKVNVNINEGPDVGAPSVFDARCLAAEVGLDLGTATNTLCLLWEELEIDGRDAFRILGTLFQVGALKVSDEEAA